MACPICDKPTETKFRPFCSRRCADIDLGKWFSGGYVIPAETPEDEEDLETALRRAETQKPH
ncbi:DNA gyrase inhibitor YacG [Yoonia sp.]|uniref:DNA gyrase inhibitor YacG n=1 Tax=Yoonia sp. TaxID=2212373 RepID=UPI0023B67EEC